MTVVHAARHCSNPITQRVWHRGTRSPDGYWHGREIQYGVPCRECEGCKRARAAVWFGRISRELNAHAASYMVTLTVRPDERYSLDAAAFGARARPEAPAELFKRRARFLVPEIQRYVKRVREAARPTQLRHCWVVEPHADHYPHVHILWHVPIEGALELNERGYPSAFETKWTWGFVSALGAVRHNERAASYCAKYLTKEAAGIVRASVRYGSTALPTEHLRTDEVSDAEPTLRSTNDYLRDTQTSLLAD